MGRNVPVKHPWGHSGHLPILLNNTHCACEDAMQVDMTVTCFVVSFPIRAVFQVACQGVWGALVT